MDLNNVARNAAHSFIPSRYPLHTIMATRHVVQIVHLASQTISSRLIFDDIVDCASATQKLKPAHQCDHSASK